MNYLIIKITYSWTLLFARFKTHLLLAVFYPIDKCNNFHVLCQSYIHIQIINFHLWNIYNIFHHEFPLYTHLLTLIYHLSTIIVSSKSRIITVLPNYSVLLSLRTLKCVIHINLFPSLYNIKYVSLLFSLHHQLHYMHGMNKHKAHDSI